MQSYHLKILYFHFHLTSQESVVKLILVPASTSAQLTLFSINPATILITTTPNPTHPGKFISQVQLI